MTITALRGPARVAPRPAARRAPRPASAVVREQTLDQVISRMWTDLTSHVTVACPVCNGAMRPRYGAGPGAVGGRCTDCGTSIG
jgi:hypothetical protein